MSKSWTLLVFVSLKYCVEKRLLKTHVAFFYESNCMCVGSEKPQRLTDEWKERHNKNTGDIKIRKEKVK
jgi:hypothetical protein